MKRTKEEYDKAIQIVAGTIPFSPAAKSVLDALCELRDSAFALEEAMKLIGELRPSVLAFALKMEEILRANDHKGHWNDCLSAYLYSRLQEEVIELLQAWQANNSELILKEAVDVGNFAMMIADNTGQLQRSALARWAASPPSPATPSPSQSNEKIMGDASAGKATGPSRGS